MATELDIGERRSKVTELLSIKGFVSLVEISQNLGVSESTARRDLEMLEEQGTIKRTHGGAVYIKDSPVHRLAFAEREMTAAAEKQAIAAAVAELIPAGQAVIINGGTTCFQVAKAVAGRRLSVITNSIPIASLLASDMATEVTLIGGYVYPRTGVALGDMAGQQIAALQATQLVLSCTGVAEDGLFNANQMMVEIERKMMEIADEVILAVDHTKFNMRGVVKLCGLDELDVIVTDSGIDGETRSRLETLRARVVVAEI